MRKKINYEKVTFLGGFGGNPPRRKRFVACNCCVLITSLDKSFPSRFSQNSDHKDNLWITFIGQIWPRLKDFEKLGQK